MGMFDEFEAPPAKPKRLFDEFSQYDKPVPLAASKAPTAAERYEAEGGGLAKSFEKGFTALTALMAPAEAMRNRQAASVAALIGVPGAQGIATDNTLPQRALEAGIQRYNTLPKNPLQDNIAQAYEAESGINAPIAAAKELVTSPKLALDYLAEMLPAAVPGGGVGGAGAKLTADAILKRAAVPALIQRVAPRAAAGAGANAGATFSGGLVPNTAGVYEENGGDLASALRVGGTQTAVESAVAAPFGAVLPFGSGVLPTAGKALVVSPVDEIAQTYLGNKSIGKETSGGELAAAGLLGATSSPVDIATALWASRQGEQGQAAPAAPQAAPARPSQTVNKPATKPGMFDEFEADATTDPMNPQPQPGAVVETARPQFGAVVETPGPHAVVERPQPRAIVEQPGPRGIVETVPPQGVVETARPQFAEPPAPDGIDLPPPESAPAIQQPAADDVELRDLTEGLIRQMRDAKQLDLDHTLRRAIDRIKTGGVNEKPAYFAKLAKEFEKKGDAKTAGVQELRGARDNGLQGMGGQLRDVPDGYGRASDQGALAGAGEERPGVSAGKRRVGNKEGAEPEQAQQQPDNSRRDDADTDGVGGEDRSGSRRVTDKNQSVGSGNGIVSREADASQRPGDRRAQGEGSETGGTGTGVRDTAQAGVGKDARRDEPGGSVDETGRSAEKRRADVVGERRDENTDGVGTRNRGEAPHNPQAPGSRVEPGAGGDSVTQQTERDLADREAQIAQREAEVAKREQEASDKARADRERDDFTLTGSDRASDANAGQGDLLGAPQQAGGKAVPDDASDVMFSRKADTRDSYERRIDDLFSGKPANRVGAVALDRSDVLDMLGLGNKPVRVAEHKVVASGTNHGLTAEHWKKIPEWLDSPAAVFDSDTQPGRLVFVASEQANGNPVVMIVKPDVNQDGLSIHLLVNAYDKTGGRMPVRRWVNDGLTRYIDKAKSRWLLESSGLQLPGVLQSRSQGANGSKRKIYTDADLVKYRASNDALFSRVDEPGTRGPVLEHDAVEAIVERVAAGLNLGIPVAVHASEAALFDAVPEIKQQAERDNAEGQISAVYFKGQVHVVSSKFASGADVETDILDALAHEGQGHYGIRAMHGNELRKALVGLFREIGGRDGVKRLADRHGLDMKLYFETADGIADPATRAAYLTDELLAHLQGKAATASLPEKIGNAIRTYIGAVREWLRTHGFENLSVGTDADIALLLKRMRAAASSGYSGRGGKPRFVRHVPAGPNSPQQPLHFQNAPGFAIDPETRTEEIQRKHQDKMNRWAKVQRQIKEQGGTVELDQDVYHAMERMTGRAADRIDSFTHDTVRPLLKRVADLKTNLDELGTYLMALGAKDRNDYIQTIRQDMPDNGSGLSNQEAAQIIADYQKRPDFAKFDALARDFQALTERKLNVWERGGVIDAAQRAELKRTFGFYVPYKGFEKIDEGGNQTGNGTGGGYSTPKRATRQAFGRVSKAGQVVENIIRDYEQAVIVAEKVNVGRYVRNLANANPDPTLWTVDQPPTRPVMVNGHVGIMQASFDNQNEIRFIENGHEVRVQLNDKLLAQTYNNLGQEPLMALMKVGDAVNRILRQTYTQKNPAFIFVNAVRDVMAGMAVATGEIGAVAAVKMLRHAPGAWKTAGLESYQRGKVTGEWAKYMDAYRKSGAQTAYYSIDDIEAKQARLHELLAREGGMSLVEGWKRGGLKKAGSMAFYKTYNNRIVDVIESLNGGFENMMRLSAFRQYIDDHGGIDSASRETLAEASRIAKNLTVNFNRKGEATRNMNALYLFWNANVQGTQNFYRAAMQSQHKGQVRAILGGLVGLGMLLAFSADDDDEDLTPDYVKDTSLTFMLGDTRIQIPLAYGLGYFVTLGRNLGNLLMERQTPTRTGMNIAGAAMQHFSPFGNVIHEGEIEAKDMLVALTPTVLKPAVMTASNRNQMGYDVVPKFGDDQPDRPAMRMATRGGLFDEAAGYVEKAGMDVSPETLKLWTQFVTGGLGTFVTDSLSAGIVGVKGEFDAEKTPIVKRFIGENDVEEHRSRFYELADDVKNQASEQGKKQKEFFGGNKARDSVMDFTKQMKALREKEMAAYEKDRFGQAERIQAQQIKLADAFKKEHDRMVKRGMIERR